MEQPKVFDDIKTALMGITILPTPRVSRETIISVLQTHTDLIMGIRKDHNSLQVHVSELDEQTRSNRKSIRILENEQESIKKDVESLYRLCDEFRKEMEELSVKVAELYMLKRQMAEQTIFVETLSNKFTKFSTEVAEYMDVNTKQMLSVQTSCDETQFQLKEMKDYVDHFADNLILNSSQITVDTYAGFSSKPIPLTEVLRMCTNNFNEMSTLTSRQAEQMTKLASSLDTKAPDSILFNISTLEKKVGTIELHIQKEEEQGMGALRKTCEQLSVQFQAITVEMADKIDRESVGLIVHEKYEEIVRYLHDALQSSLEDENNFKEKADEIQEMVILLSNSKADRTEIANMQEVMVKSEALLKKVGAQANLKEKIKEFVSRKEIEALLSSKVDRTDFEQQLQAAMVNSRKTRRLSSLANGLQPVQDNAFGGGGSALGGGAMGGGGGEGSDSIRKSVDQQQMMQMMMSQQQAQAQQQQGYYAQQQGGGGGGYGANNTGGNNRANNGGMSVSFGNNPNNNNRSTSPSQQQMMMMMTSGSMPTLGSGNNSGGQFPAGLRSNVAAAAAGAVGADGRAFTIDGSMQPPPRQVVPVPVIALGLGLTGGAGNGSNKGQPQQTSDFSSFLKGKNGGNKGKELLSSSLPSVDVPGGFRRATEAGRSGGSPVNIGGQFNNHASMAGYGASEFPYVQAAGGDDSVNDGAGEGNDHLAYLQGPVMGGGFNVKARRVQKAALGGTVVTDVDVEGKGLMVKGKDGHMYYQDLSEKAAEE